MVGGSLRAAPVAEALGRCCVVRGGRVGWAPARWADGAVPARRGSRGVPPGPTCGGWSHLRRMELAREERLVAVLSLGVTQLKEAAGRIV